MNVNIVNMSKILTMNSQLFLTTISFGICNKTAAAFIHSSLWNTTNASLFSAKLPINEKLKWTALTWRDSIGKFDIFTYKLSSNMQ